MLLIDILSGIGSYGCFLLCSISMPMCACYSSTLWCLFVSTYTRPYPLIMHYIMLLHLFKRLISAIYIVFLVISKIVLSVSYHIAFHALSLLLFVGCTIGFLLLAYPFFIGLIMLLLILFRAWLT